jgi:2'-5' RNA ligase
VADKQNMNDHAYARNNFMQLGRTIKNQHRDFHEWHMGRSRYAIWAIDIDTPEICQLVLAAEQHLAGLLLEDYCRKPHITLCVCGFPTDEVKQADDFSASSLETQVSNLSRLNLKPFEIEIDSLASFSSAPFFHIKDPDNNIAALNECLSLGIQSNHNERYIPHITIGLYADAWSSNAVSIRLDSFPKPENLRCSVSQISLMSYSPSEIGGELKTIADYRLDEAELIWHEKTAFGR